MTFTMEDYEELGRLLAGLRDMPWLEGYQQRAIDEIRDAVADRYALLADEGFDG